MLDLDALPIFGRRVAALLQAEAAECGIACLAMVAGYHGLDCDLGWFRARFTTSLRGTNLSQLMQMAAEVRLSPRAVRLEPASLRSLTVPCVLHWNMDHFVVLERATHEHAWIVDPASGRKRLSLAEVSKYFSGVALELSPAKDFRKETVHSRPSLSDFFRGVIGIRSTLAKLLLLSLSIQVFALLVPFYSQLVIDEAIASGDVDLLTLLLVGFGLVVVLSTCVTALRSFVVMHFGSRLQYEWAARLFHHLLRLPLGFFEKRHMADTLSRFRSLGPVQNLVTTTIVEALIDGIMAITTLAVMLVYGPYLTLVAAVALASYAAVRVLTYGVQRDNAQEVLVKGAKENSHFLESLRGILAVKSFAKEQIRESTWRNHAANAIHSGYRMSLLGNAQRLTNQLIFGVEGLTILWLGARSVIAGDLTLGMLMAFLAFKGQFTARTSALIDKVFEYRLVSVHLDRLADITGAEEENGVDGTVAELPAFLGSVEARGVAFRHSQTDPVVFKDVNFKVQPGECVAIVGPSGAGKTTLLKVMMGLLAPSAGAVLVDGKDLQQGLLSAYRRQIASVMQEDMLLSGTLADNIAFFDPRPDMARVEACARTAAIHDDIMATPMGYLTLVGDMGAALSGGQKQRVLLARALYAGPRILFLDEATSHLDPETEKRIHAALGEMQITRIMVAHRKETTAVADRVVHIRELQRVASEKVHDLPVVA